MPGEIGIEPHLWVPVIYLFVKRECEVFLKCNYLYIINIENILKGEIYVLAECMIWLCEY